jgi:hypothetical protein
MKILGYQVSALLCVAVIVGMFAAGPMALGKAPANGNFDGTYHGSYSGTFAGESATGSVAFSVKHGGIAVTDPGQGTGSVDHTGATTFSGSLPLGKIACKFVGNFKSASGKKHGAHASGSWSCVGMGESGKGTWSADQQ